MVGGGGERNQTMSNVGDVITLNLSVVAKTLYYHNEISFAKCFGAMYHLSQINKEFIMTSTTIQSTVIHLYNIFNTDQIAVFNTLIALILTTNDIFITYGNKRYT